MKPKIDIKFDQNEYGVYFSGQVVSGKVDISFAKAKKVRGIALQITGYATCQWKSKYQSWNGEDHKKKTLKAQFTGREEYVSTKTYLVGSEVSTPVDILPGIHSYNFACAIPSFAPSSFEGAHGHIRYIVKIVLDRPWKFDQTYSKGFTVLKTVDLNYDSPLLRIPAEIETMKQYWCVCPMKPLILKAKIPQTGFVPGQAIPIRTEILNGSAANVSEVKIYLIQIISYRADSPTTDCKEETIEVVTKSAPGVSARSTTEFDESLVVPSLPPTSQMHSKIIQISYEVKVKAIVTGHSNPFVTVPITIGTVPLYNSSQQPLGSSFAFDTPQSQSAPPSAYFDTRMDLGTTEAPLSLPVIAPVLNRAPSTPNGNISPPTYEESIIMMRAQVDEGEEHSLERSEYVPRYPVYNFDTPSAPQEFLIAEDVLEGKYYGHDRIPGA